MCVVYLLVWCVGVTCVYVFGVVWVRVVYVVICGVVCGVCVFVVYVFVFVCCLPTYTYDPPGGTSGLL